MMKDTFFIISVKLIQHCWLSLSEPEFSHKCSFFSHITQMLVNIRTVVPSYNLDIVIIMSFIHPHAANIVRLSISVRASIIMKYKSVKMYKKEFCQSAKKMYIASFMHHVKKTHEGLRNISDKWARIPMQGAICFQFLCFGWRCWCFSMTHFHSEVRLYWHNMLPMWCIGHMKVTSTWCCDP